VNQCAWSLWCEERPLGDSQLCYFHEKRLRGLIGGELPGPGLHREYRPPDKRAKQLLEALRGVEESK
jgi:hypothetical protein